MRQRALGIVHAALPLNCHHTQGIGLLLRELQPLQQAAAHAMQHGLQAARHPLSQVLRQRGAMGGGSHPVDRACDKRSEWVNRGKGTQMEEHVRNGDTNKG